MEANTLALSTQVTIFLRRFAARRKENSCTRSEPLRVMTMVSRASRSSSTTPLPRDANRPSVDSRTTTRSMSFARGSASGNGMPGMARTGRTPA